MKRDRKKAQCVFCGNFAIIDRDHIPPICIFPKPRPSNLITVPSCEECHKATTKDDEYFRLMIVNRYNVSKQTEVLKVIPKIKKSLKRSESKFFRKSFYDSLQIKNVSTINGIYIGDVITYSPDLDRIRSVTNRIIKGLFFNIKKYRLPNNCNVHSSVMEGTTQREAQEVADVFGLLRAKPKVIARGVFYYYCHFFTNTNNSIWLLVFYDSVEIVGLIKCSG